MATIKNLKIKIVSFTAGGYPGWILCSFQDSKGNAQFFEEKVPVVTTDDLNENSKYPLDFTIPCEILTEANNIITIDLARPYGIEARNGETIFQVFSDQLSDF